MAEGFGRAILEPRGVRVFSAGSSPAEGIHPFAVRVMAEAGVDLGKQRPKPLSEVPLDEVDTIVTLCAEEVCPVLPGRDAARWLYPDPGRAPGTDEDRLEAFRRVRDDLRRRVGELLEPAGGVATAPPAG